MVRKAIYWLVIGLLALLAVFAGVNYLCCSEQAAQGFAHVGHGKRSGVRRHA